MSSEIDSIEITTAKSGINDDYLERVKKAQIQAAADLQSTVAILKQENKELKQKQSEYESFMQRNIIIHAQKDAEITKMKRDRSNQQYSPNINIIRNHWSNKENYLFLL